MKLATLKNGNRDGRPVVVSRDLRLAQRTEAAPSLQAALDSWDRTALLLSAQSEVLDAGEAADTTPFDPAACTSPLPRAYQWADGSAYVNHVELVRKARGAELP